MIALDTNLLIYAHIPSMPEHRSARMAMEKVFNEGPCGIALSSLSEFWSVTTQTRPGRAAASLDEAKGFIEALTQDNHLKIWHPSIGFHQRLMDLAYRLKVGGFKIFDLQIGLLALENKASEIWTHDENFIKLPGLKIHDPIK